ncbi:hypothetical protein [Desulfosporosinus sp. HMP52]|nr:hypothetical protein [Desulfosporosinus sp. HMP52]
MIVSWNTTIDCNMACDHCYRAAYYNHGDYMAEEPWCLYHRRKGV